MASLTTAEGASFELAEGETLLGRGGREYNDPPKVDVGPLRGGPTVSRQHARIFRRAGQWYLKVEVEARNPTLVGGRRIQGGEEAPLVDNTRIQIGDVVLTFKAPTEAPAYAPDMTMAEGNGHTSLTPTPTAPPPLVTPIIVAAAAPTTEPPIATPAPQAPMAPPPIHAAPAQPAKAAAWVARLPGRPPTLETLGVPEFKRVNPFRGLMIDEAAWGDAHNYHMDQMRLHVLSAHGWGIIEGLEVVAEPHVPNTLVIRPGVAFDAQGRALMVTQERRMPVTASPGTTLFVALGLRDELAMPQRFWNDLDEYTRVVEKCEAHLQTNPPASPAMELARLVVDGPVRNSQDPLAPQRGEIDLRFRERLMVRPRPDLGVAKLVPGGGDAAAWAACHRFGLRFLLREIGLTTAYRARWAGIFQMGEPLPNVSLLYLSGPGAFAVAEAAIGRLRDFLQGGGVILADACHDAQGPEFAASVQAMASALGVNLQLVGRWHPMLLARNVFAEAPLAGQDSTYVAEGDGLILSTADYGCAWQGGGDARPLSRDHVRAALEMGVNMAVYARQRQRPLEIAELEV